MSVRKPFLLPSILVAGLAMAVLPAGSTYASATKDAQGVTASQILIGTSGPLTGPIAAYGAVSEGANAYFQYVNAHGGINGRKIKLIMLDDQYQPDLGVVNARKLVAAHVFATVSLLGTSVVEAMEPILLKAGIPMTGVATGSSHLTFPPNPKVWGFEPTYTLEGHLLLAWAVHHRGVRTIGVFYQNDDFGREGLAALQQEAKKDHVRIVATASYNPTGTDFTSQAETLVTANPQAIFEFSVPEPTAQFMKDLQEFGYKGQQYVSDVSGDPFFMFLLAGSAFNNVYSDGYMPSLNTARTRNFVNAWKKYYPTQPASQVAESGWVEAQILAHAITMCGNNLTWANLQKQMNSIRNWTGALTLGPVTYTPKFHAGTNEIQMVQADGKFKTMRPVSGLIQYVETKSALQP